MIHDAIVAGGSYAGMAAALQLLRARRRVLVIDAGQRRNRAAATSHGFLTHDGADPAEIARTARAQLARYSTLTWVDDVVVSASGERDAFTVETGGGTSHEGRRLLLAIGVSDALPALPGLAERWGRSVFHCPYCHGYELDRGAIGVIATGPLSLHQALLLAEWGTVTLLANGALDLDADARASLHQRGVAIEATPVARLDGRADAVLADGRVLRFAGLFAAPRNAPASDLAQQLGCGLMDTPMGVQIRTDEAKQTTVPGVYACGDAARVPHSVSLAVGDGAWAGAQVHQSLVFPAAT
ncbi:NAD(P)/FAD-dependent oxidoreductase [Luteimonas sp. M1R5S18]|jgi:thioredoxin reductase|uniref:NAD(P)/FAD-dependent oxidoreductase n=1 Tax=Luteimonas rhizosphaericola TaxID=3042024 RepID=A0ABT6JLW6_9GAMM|nr:NAD(P)/FAD-dependent oxidoreductase [Luteimonas rhizosphaericola]MDH5831664.1 NAD(P)/FAD-dependent oxidoreductase [Luteimonas rhizosphaericola]